MAITKLAPYLVSIDDTWSGTNTLWAADTLQEAKGIAEKRIGKIRSGSIVIRSSTTDVVIDYYEK